MAILDVLELSADWQPDAAIAMRFFELISLDGAPIPPQAFNAEGSVVVPRNLKGHLTRPARLRPRRRTRKNDVNAKFEPDRTRFFVQFAEGVL